jgi:hypothetical protein
MAVGTYLPPVVTRLSMDLRDFTADVAKAKALISSLHTSVTVNVDVDDPVATAKLAAITASVGALATASPTIHVGMTGTLTATAALKALKDTIDDLNLAISSMSGRITRNIARMGAWAVAATALNATLLPLAATLAGMSGSAAAITPALRARLGRPGGAGGGTLANMPGWAGWLFSLFTNKGKIPLFNGGLGTFIPALVSSTNPFVQVVNHLLNMTNVAHLAIEAVVELTAVWGPATLAALAFGAAAYPTAKLVYSQLLNMHTAALATGLSFKSLATSGESIAKAVRPSVLEAFGIGLYTIQRDSGTLAPILSQVGQSIDQIMARISAAVSNNGTLMQHGATDLNLLMTAFGNLFGVIGNLMHTVPGYAEVLLQFGTDVLGFAEKISGGIVEKALGVFLKLHGAIFYGGLFGTASAWGFAKVVGGLTSVTEMIASLAVKAGLASPIITGLGKALLALDFIGSPGMLAVVGLVVGGVAALVMYLRASKNAAQQFGATMQQALSSASGGQLQTLLRTDMAQNAQRLAAATKNLAKAQDEYNAAVKRNPTVVAGRAGLVGGPLAQQEAVQKASQAVSDYRANSQQLSSQQVNLTSNLKAVAKQFGVSLPNALTLASAAQVTNNQLMGSGANNLAQIEALIGGYIAQLRVMTDGTGNLGSALHALNVTTSSQYQAIQNVTGAYSTWIGIVTGGDSAFAAFEQGQSTLITDLTKGGEKVNTTLGKISDKFTTVKSSLNGTSASALAARQAFDAQVSSAVSLYNSLATMAAVSGNSAVAQHALYQAGKDVVAQLLPLARGSQEATTQVYALAQIAGYAGNNSYAGLVRWLGRTKNAEKDLNKQQDLLTSATANLSQDAKNLASGLQGVLTQAMVNAIANTAQLNQSTQNLANAFGSSKGKITSNVNAMARNYIQSLKQMGFSDSQIEGALGALAGSFIHNRSEAQKWADQAVQSADRVQQALNSLQSKTITVTMLTQTLNSQANTTGPRVGVSSPSSLKGRKYALGTSGAASGWAWVGEAGPELVRFRGGETVIPSGTARGYAAGTEDSVHEINVYLDGKQIYRDVQSKALTKQRRTGSNGLSRRTR